MTTQRATSIPAGFTTFGSLLRFLRQRQRLTQRDLAIATGYSTGQISRLEQNQRLPNPSTIRALFVPALELNDAPELVDRLIELAQAAHIPDADDPADDERWAAAAAPVAETGPATAAAPPGPLLLVTKLYVPRPRSVRVARTGLLARLDAALQVPLTLVAAPAGFGKTTLLADWLSQWSVASEQRQAAPIPGIAWLTLDDGDNDPTTFLRYLIAAIATLTPTVGSAPLALLQSPQPPGPEQIVRLLLNDLVTLPHTALLVLDDYHLITLPTIHAALAVLLEHLPPTLHVVIATRADPPLPIARMRARGQIVELRAAELRFSAAEAGLFLGEVMGLALTEADIAALDARTEGWIAGLQLAALAMRDRGDLPGFVNAFTGNNRFVVDYLAAEVFERQPAHIQRFLLQTSLLDRLCGPLCDAVMGVGPPEPPIGPVGSPHVRATQPAQMAFTQALLEDLERSNLFLLPLDDERRWYRYHHLFAQVLRERLLSGAPSDMVGELHRRAASWFAAQGLIPEAVQHTLATRDWERAASLLEQHGRVLALQGQVSTVLGWLKMLPEAVLREHPLLCIYQAQLLTWTNQLGAAEARLQDAEAVLQRGVPADQVRLIEGNVAAVRAEVVRFSGDFNRGVTLARQALALLPTTETLARARVRSLVVLDCFATGDMTATTQALAEEIVAESRASGTLLTYHAALSDLGWVHMFQGQLHTAAAIFAEAQTVAQTAGVRTLAMSVYDLLGMGDVLREWGQLDAAEAHLTGALSLATEQSTLNTYAFLVGAVVLARLLEARGAHQPALEILDRFAALARATGVPPLQLGVVAAVRTQLTLADGDLAGAAQWAADSGCRRDDPVGFARENEYLTLARVWIAQGRLGPAEHLLDDALDLLGRLLADAERGERVGSMIETLILVALAYAARGDQSAARAALTRAVTLAAPEGFLRMFLDEGAPLAALLAAMTQAPGPVHPYSATLLAAFGAGAPAAAAGTPGRPHGANSALLSERERAVLRLVANGLSNAEIAAQLVVGVSTVKKHINNIFGKLGVISRTQALARARDLGLL